MRTLIQSLFVGWFFALAARGDVTLASLFRDHAILQRDQRVPVWGRADPGERVMVEFRGQSVSATADAHGKWRIELEPLAVSAEPAELVVRGKNKLTLSDVLTGEVWLASGQSNMKFRVELANDAVAEIAGARYPFIRQFNVPTLVAGSPQEAVGGKWVGCSPETVAQFSAVAYYFARDVHLAAGVPVGIINSTWGGTPVESWVSGPTIAGNPAFRAMLERWRQTSQVYPVKKEKYDSALAAWEKADTSALATGPDAQAAFRKVHAWPRPPRGPGHQWTPAGLYNGMIAPLVPYALSGALWYQGESNADYPEEYAAMFSAVIRQWRLEWRREFPFYFVQIANFNGNAVDRAPGQWAWLREAQAQALALPATGMAVTIDIGTPNDIHPKNKQEVGRRLALIARHELLKENVEFSGPRLAHSQRDGAVLRLSFTHAAGLNSGSQSPADFIIAGEDRKFHPASAHLEGETVVLSSPTVPQPVAARYAWPTPRRHICEMALDYRSRPFARTIGIVSEIAAEETIHHA